MDCTHESMTALEQNIIGVGYHAMCLNCGEKVFIDTSRKAKIETAIKKLTDKGYSLDVASKIVLEQVSAEDEDEKTKREDAARREEENRRRK